MKPIKSECSCHGEAGTDIDGGDIIEMGWSGNMCGRVADAIVERINALEDEIARLAKKLYDADQERAGWTGDVCQCQDCVAWSAAAEKETADGR